MRIYYAMEGRHKASFPHDRVPKQCIRSWCPPSNEINLPRDHPNPIWGFQNGGRLGSGDFDATLDPVIRLNPLDPKSTGLVMLDAEWSVPRDMWDLQFLDDLRTSIIARWPGIRFGMYHHNQPAGIPVVDYTVLHGYVQKPVRPGKASSAYWDSRELKKALEGTLATRVPSVACVMTMHRNYVGTNKDKPIGDYEMCMVIDAAMEAKADIMVWDSNNATTEQDASDLHLQCVAFIERICRRLDGIYGA